jgi:hypothetical protein
VFFTTCFNICQGVRASPGQETPIGRAGADEGHVQLVAQRRASGLPLANAIVRFAVARARGFER